MIDDEENEQQGIKPAALPYRIVVRDWKPVGLIKFNPKKDTCGICHESLEKSCLSCQSSRLAPDQCPSSEGRCGHIFHGHCISHWLANQTTCPGVHSDEVVPWMESISVS